MSNASRKLLRDALSYFARGIAPIPVSGKRPLVAYKSRFDRLPSEDEVRADFARRNVRGVAVLNGPSVCTRDFDSLAAYHEFCDREPVLARELPTVVTPRGRHLWCVSNVRKVIRLADGELRGAGVTIAPHSVHPSGQRYEWAIALPKGELPLVESERLIGASAGKYAAPNVTERHSSPSALSVTSPSSSPCSSASEVVEATLPRAIGERNRKLFDLARGLKLNCELADVDAVKGIVRRWHRLALRIIRTKAFDETWRDFTHAWDRVRQPLSLDFVDRAALLVDPNDLPEAASRYDVSTRRLIGLCASLAELNGSEGRFFLSTRDAAERLNVSTMQAWRLLRSLETDRVIGCEKRGAYRTKRATRYVYHGENRWLGKSERGALARRDRTDAGRRRARGSSNDTTASSPSQASRLLSEPSGARPDMARRRSSDP